MRIDLQLAGYDASATKTDSVRQPTADRNNSTGRSREIQDSFIATAASNSIADDPIRNDRITELRAQIQAGTYRLDPAQIADSMVASMFHR